MSIVDVLTVNGTVTVFPVERVPASNATFEVDNATWYPLWVKFGGAAAPMAPSAVNRAQWDYIVGAGDDAVLPTPPGFDGNVWVGVFIAANKLASGLPQYATLASFAAGEQPIVASATPTTLLPQLRVVTVPVVPHVNAVVAISGTGAISGVQTLANLATFSALSAPQPFTVYLYGLALSAWQFKRARLNIVAMAKPSGTSVQLGFARLWAGAPQAPIVTGAPWAASVAASAGDTQIAIAATAQLVYPAVPGNWAIDGSIEADVDSTGQIPPPAIGNGASTPAGAVY